MALDVKALVDDLDARYGKQGKKYVKRYAKHARRYAGQAARLERKLERHAAKLPVDTPLDRRRRLRRTRSAGRGAVVLAVLGGAAVLVWRTLRSGDAERTDAAPAEAGPAPDVFGSAVDRAEPVVATRA
jgi:ferric-dicitrate binding protein FerR (iron transport regulator)